MFILFSGCRDDDVDCGGEAESFKGRCFYILFNSPFGSTTRNKPRAVRPFRIFSQILGDIRSSRFATGVNDTGGKWKKPSSRKILIILFGHLWVVELTYI